MGRDGVFDQNVAATYDRLHGGTDAQQLSQSVATLKDLAAGGDVLEFAIGTGRIALPLIEAGVRVSGIELSSAMVEELRKKPGGADIEVALGDMTTTQIDGAFSLVMLVFNTISNLTAQDAQVACFENAAAHLRPGGRFVVENQVPPLQRLPFGETLLAFAADTDHWGTDEFDVTTQKFTSHHIWKIEGSQQHLSVPFRYVWPSELDLMAKIAGMELEARWEDWTRAPFNNLSRSHISVWKKM